MENTLAPNFGISDLKWEIRARKLLSRVLLAASLLKREHARNVLSWGGDKATHLSTDKAPPAPKIL